MKIIIFGGNGFIGSVLQKKLREESYKVSVFDLSTEDVRKPETFINRLKKEKADVVVNLAAILGTMKKSPSVLDLYEINTIGNLNVLKIIHEIGIKNYIFTSSMTVHGQNDIGKHQNRFSLFNPKQPYAASKASAEFSMVQFLKEAPEMKLVVVRPTMVLGKGTYLPHAPIEFVKTIFSGKDIEIYGKGLHEREWIWIDDVVLGIIKAIEYSVSAKPGYHPFFLSGSRISMRDLAKKVAKKLKGKVVFTPSTTQAFTLTADSRDSQKILKWSPKENIDTMLDKIIDLYKNA